MSEGKSVNSWMPRFARSRVRNHFFLEGVFDGVLDGVLEPPFLGSFASAVFASPAGGVSVAVEPASGVADAPAEPVSEDGVLLGIDDEAAPESIDDGISAEASGISVEGVGGVVGLGSEPPHATRASGARATSILREFMRFISEAGFLSGFGHGTQRKIPNVALGTVRPAVFVHPDATIPVLASFQTAGYVARA